MTRLLNGNADHANYFCRETYTSFAFVDIDKTMVSLVSSYVVCDGRGHQLVNPFFLTGLE